MHGLLGVWKLVGGRALDEAGRETSSPFGPAPVGLVLFERERMMAMVADGRTALPPGAPGRGFFAYTGTYKLDGDTLTTRVDGASSAEGMADQVRRIAFEGPDRFVAVPLSRVLGRGSGLEFVWERVG